MVEKDKPIEVVKRTNPIQDTRNQLVNGCVGHWVELHGNTYSVYLLNSRLTELPNGQL